MHKCRCGAPLAGHVDYCSATCRADAYQLEAAAMDLPDLTPEERAGWAAAHPELATELARGIVRGWVAELGPGYHPDTPGDDYEPRLTEPDRYDYEHDLIDDMSSDAWSIDPAGVALAELELVGPWVDRCKRGHVDPLAVKNSPHGRYCLVSGCGADVDRVRVDDLTDEERAAWEEGE